MLLVWIFLVGVLVLLAAIFIKSILKGAFIGAVVVTIIWILIGVLVNSPSTDLGWSGMEIVFLAPYFLVLGAIIGAILGPIGSLAKQNKSS